MLVSEDGRANHACDPILAEANFLRRSATDETNREMWCPFGQVSSLGSERMFSQLSSRQWFAGIALVTAGLMAYAFYAEHVLGLEPCPLCMFQRVAMALVGSICLLAAIHGARGVGIRVYATLAFIAAALGAAISGRHVWLQSLPKDQLPSCAPPMDFMWDNMPFGAMLKTIMMTSGECANIDWEFLGLSMPAWTLVCFVLMVLVMLYVAIAPRTKPI